MSNPCCSPASLQKPACLTKHTQTHTQLLSRLYSCFISHPRSLFSFCSALIFCPSLCCYLMELSHDVRCYVRWQQSRQVKATLSSLETTCELPTCSLALFCFSSDHSLRSFFLFLNPPAGAKLCSEMSNCHPVADKRWRWLQSEGSDKQLRMGWAGDSRKKSLKLLILLLRAVIIDPQVARSKPNSHISGHYPIWEYQNGLYFSFFQPYYIPTELPQQYGPLK